MTKPIKRSRQKYGTVFLRSMRMRHLQLPPIVIEISVLMPCMGTVLSGMDGGQSQFQLWTGGVLDFIYNFTFIPALAHRHATGSIGDLFLNQPVQGFFRGPCPWCGVPSETDWESRAKIGAVCKNASHHLAAGSWELAAFHPFPPNFFKATLGDFFSTINATLRCKKVAQNE